MNQPLTQQRLRIKFGKHGALRFVGHLDLAQTWERIMRRAQVPLEYTQGYNPRPRIQIAAALPVGVTSECEYLDAWLTAQLEVSSPDEWIARLQATCPEGLRVYHIEEVEIRGPALPTLVSSSEYVITLVETSLGSDELESRVAALLARPQIERTRNKKAYDLRPMIFDLVADPAGKVIAHLATGDKANGRPDELLDSLGIDPGQARIHRRCLNLCVPE